MKYSFALAAALAVTSTSAYAGGLDRSGQPIGILFEQGNYAELSLGYADPSLTGSDTLGNSISNVGDSFFVLGAGVKADINEQLSFAFLLDQPYGVDILYGGSPATTMLGGTNATADTVQLTGILRYKFADRFSIYGGPSFLRAEGNIGLSGLAYGPISGYNADFAQDGGWGFVAGAAYEIPAIALRFAVTYRSSIDLDFATTETIGGAPIAPVTTTSSEIPESWTIDFQTGIAKDTLLFASIRYVTWEDFTLIPAGLSGAVGAPTNLAEIDDATTYTIGVGRKFTDQFSGSLSFTYDEGGPDDLVSPLAPTNGSMALALGGRYQLSEKVRLSAGIRYTWFEDALPETGTPDTQRATFTNNDAISAGFKVGFNF
ncbi:hypothetical protein DDZ14_06695 [Maritimibacter sp. 55A14]|uniref:OmpP1/FadL family transporter n=1 Tax=Maritimibacter sp. 55A14 TaxID=2174844 RepID=UPI000D61A451|nr:outer membrane protein transport protein [Maritimibacter sp. 55A14]PWE33100.1 hypothetical protein DDZ14_06695 [Maritimibacter sp. 55A14]